MERCDEVRIKISIKVAAFNLRNSSAGKPNVHEAMGCDPKSSILVWWCHQLLYKFLANVHLPLRVIMRWNWGSCTDLLEFTLWLRKTSDEDCATSYHFKWGLLSPNEVSRIAQNIREGERRKGWGMGINDTEDMSIQISLRLTTGKMWWRNKMFELSVRTVLLFVSIKKKSLLGPKIELGFHAFHTRC